MKTMIVVLSIFAGSLAFAAKTYQVTGPITALTDSKITVQKGSEKWEVDRTAATKINGDLKVGQKVTIEYTMTADKVEVKK
ncbi:hypothetical protein D3C72_2286070 [compost metagenome]